MRIASIEATIKAIEKAIAETKLAYIRQKLEKVLSKLKNKRIHLPDGTGAKVMNNFRCPQCDGGRYMCCYDDNGNLLFDSNGDIKQMICPKCHGIGYVMQLHQ